MQRFMPGGLIGLSLLLALPALGEAVPSRSATVLEGVPGLEERVTYTETKIPLGELIAKVAQDTHVALTAAPDVADEPVAVVVKEFPARQLLEEVADLLGYRWGRRSGAQAFGRSGRDERPTANAEDRRQTSVTPPEPRTAPPSAQAPERPNARTPVFVIYQDLAGRQEEEALRSRQGATVERGLQEQFESLVQMAACAPAELQAVRDQAERQVREILHAPPAERQARTATGELERLVRRQVTAESLSAPIPRAVAELVGRLTPAQWALLGQGQRLMFSTGPGLGALPLPADVARALRASRPSSAAGSRLSEAARRGEQALADQWAAATDYRVTVEVRDQRHGGEGSLCLTANAQPLRAGAPPGPMFTPSAYRTGITLYSMPPSTWESAAGLTPTERAALEKDPLLGVKRPLPAAAATAGSPPTGGQGRRFRDLLPDLARAYDVQFLADAYWNSPPGKVDLRSLPQPVALYEILDRYASPSYRWERHDNLVRLRNRTWFQRRPREIPLRLVRRWMALFEERGGLPVEEFVTMAQSLLEAQLESLREVVWDTGLPPSMTSIHDGRYLLRLYGALTSAQREALRRGRDLDVGQMTSEQQALFWTAVTADPRFVDRLRDLKEIGAGSLSMDVHPFAVMREIPGKGIRTRRAQRGIAATKSKQPARLNLVGSART